MIAERHQMYHTPFTFEPLWNGHHRMQVFETNGAFAAMHDGDFAKHYHPYHFTNPENLHLADMHNYENLQNIKQAETKNQGLWKAQAAAQQHMDNLAKQGVPFHDPFYGAHSAGNLALYHSLF